MFADIVGYKTSLFFNSSLSHWRLGTEQGWRLSRSTGELWYVLHSSSLRFSSFLFRSDAAGLTEEKIHQGN